MVKSPSNRTTTQRGRADRGRVEMAARNNTSLLSPKLGRGRRRGKCLLKEKIKKKMVKVRKLSAFRLITMWFCSLLLLIAAQHFVSVFTGYTIMPSPSATCDMTTNYRQQYNTASIQDRNVIQIQLEILYAL